MKKLGIGCLIVLVLFGVVGLIGGYLVYDRLYKPAAEYVASFKELGAMAELEREVKNTASFTEPADGELSEDLLERFMSVQDAMRSRLGTRLEGLKAKYDELEAASEGANPSVRAGLDALKDLASLLMEAKRAQVDALNAAGFSVKEYEWVRNQAYAGLGIIAGGFDLKNLAQAAAEGGQGLRTELGEVSEHNRELIKRYEEKLRELAPLAFFGL